MHIAAPAAAAAEVLLAVYSLHVLDAFHSEYLPAGHATHIEIKYVEDENVAEYLPAAHASHGPPSGPANPAMHRHTPALLAFDTCSDACNRWSDPTAP